MVESGDLGLVETLGKRGELSLGLGIEGIGGEGGVGGGRGDSGGVSRLVAAGEQTGEEASQAQRGDFNEIAFRARSRQKGHELGSKVFHRGTAQIEASVLGGIWGDNDTFEAAFWWAKDVDWSVGCCRPWIDNKELVRTGFGLHFGRYRQVQVFL